VETSMSLGYPLFVKPVRAGSSFGVSRVESPGSLSAAVEAAFRHDGRILLEEAVPGFEVGCAVMGNPGETELTVGAVDEIELSGGFFDFGEKYTLRTSAIHCPARISPSQAARVQAAARAQRAYLAGAQARSEQTRAFRHDIRNHLSVLDGLLRRGELEAGRAYLSKLEAVSASLTGPYQTGSPVVDILLGEKLGLAPEITAEVALVLPQPCGIDEPDLCVIFANALDNAVAACRAGGDAPFLRVAGQRQGDFYLLTFENTCPEGPLPPPGTGLASLRAAAGKYRGAVQTEKAGGRFTLSVLLDIS